MRWSSAWPTTHPSRGASPIRRAGADIAVTYLNEKADPHVRPLAESVRAPIIMQLDVTWDEHEEPLFR